MKTWSRQLEELTSQVAQLKMEKQELQQRNRILESSLTVNTHHEERLHCNEVRLRSGRPAPSLSCSAKLALPTDVRASQVIPLLGLVQTLEKRNRHSEQRVPSRNFTAALTLPPGGTHGKYFT